MKYISTSEEQTKSIAKQIINEYKDNNLFFLVGDIGVGKTTFAKGVGESLDINENVTSPTFGIKSEYKGFIHYDLYLSKKKVDISSILFEDERKGIVVIEWADKLPKSLLKEGIQVHISKNNEKRIIEVK